MPAPDQSSGADPAGRGPRDLSAIPAFLRHRAAAATPTADGQAFDGLGRSGPGGRLVLRRPANPPLPPVATPSRRFDPTTLPMPKLSGRRVVTAAGVLVAGWLVLSFVRQVGDAAAAAQRADALRQLNAALQDEVATLERELGRVQDARFILQQGRAVGLGGPREIPFALAAGAPELGSDAPGSAAVRLGAPPERSPLEAWLGVLFGPSGQG